MNNDKLSPQVARCASHSITELAQYAPDMIVSTAIIKKPTGHICVFAYDKGQKSEIKTSPFENHLQVIHGTLELHINAEQYALTEGQGFVIPAHFSHQFVAKEQFKMISTVIKSGYED